MRLRGVTSFLKAGEINNDDFWQSLKKKKEEANSESAKVEFTSLSHSLDKNSVRAEAALAGSYANSDISISGLDAQGDRLRGDNNDFTLKTEIEDLSRRLSLAALQMYNKFRELIAAGVVNLPSESPATTSKLNALNEHDV